jgi:hypothetical protein
MSTPCCSQINHLKHALYASLVPLCLCVFTPSPMEDFSRVSFSCICPLALRINVFLALGTSMSATLIPPLQHSILLLFFKLSKIVEKDKKIKYTPKRGREKYFLVVDTTMSRPWTKHIILFVPQALRFNRTLGSYSRYIELCPPPFGYPSKHMESSHCLMHCELMSIPCFLSLIFCRSFVQGKFY